MPKSAEAERERFRALVPSGPGVTVRPMFGNLAAFVNGNMFCGIFGDQLFVRLDETEQNLLREAGGGDFEVMPGRAMKGYTTVPDWQTSPAASDWLGRALAFTAGLPPKK